MTQQRTPTPTMAPQSAPVSAPTNAGASPLLQLQGLIGNAGLLDLLRPSMPATEAEPSPLAGALQTVLQQDVGALATPPGGAEAPSTAVAASLAEGGKTGALAQAPSSPALSAAAQVEALAQTPEGVEGAVQDSPTLAAGVAGELGTTPSQVQAQASREDTYQPGWWEETVDAAVEGGCGLIDLGVDAISEVPVLGTLAEMNAPGQRFTLEVLGGFAKGAGDMVGGLAQMVAHPLDTLGGLATMAEHLPMSPLKQLHRLYDVATGNKTLEETFLRSPLEILAEDQAESDAYWGKVGEALLEPYKRSVDQGRYGDALGRGIFDIGGLFVGAGEAKALGKGARVAADLNKVDDAVRVAETVNEISKIGDDLAHVGNKADDVTKSASQVDEVADLNKADDGIRLPASKEAHPGPSADESNVSTQSGAGATDASHGTETRAVDDLAEGGQEPLRKVTPEALDARIEAIQAHPLLGGDLDQLQKVIHDARLGQAGALGELQAIERWLAEGKPVEVLTEVQNAGLKNPDYRVADKMTEVKTRGKPLSKSYIKDEIKDANRQIKQSGTGEVGQVEIQLEDGAAGADIATLESQVRSQFHGGTSSSLDRVAVYSEGELVGEWIRGADGSVIRTFPADGVTP